MPMIVFFEGRGCRNACICLTTAGKFGRLEENGCGFTLTPGDGEALTERILARGAFNPYGYAPGWSYYFGPSIGLWGPMVVIGN